MNQFHQRHVAALCGAAMFALPFHANAEAAKDKALADSERMIARCLEHAASQQYAPLSIGVVDTSGTLIAFRRQDGASPATADAALLKARTSVRLNAPTAALAEVAAADAPARDAFLIMQLTTIPGGLPFTDDDGRLLGAIGVSGSRNEQDAACAARATDALKSKRK